LPFYFIYYRINLYLRFINEVIYMARIVRPVWAIRCQNSSCRELFEVVTLTDNKQQEVVCPKCGEHYIYPPQQDDEVQE